MRVAFTHQGREYRGLLLPREGDNVNAVVALTPTRRKVRVPRAALRDAPEGGRAPLARARGLMPRTAKAKASTRRLHWAGSRYGRTPRAGNGSAGFNRPPKGGDARPTGGRCFCPAC